MRIILAFALLTACAPALAVTLDGSTAGDNYSLRTVQTVQTQFGDNFSELNAGYATIDNDTLYLALTGNLEGNFNKLNVFIDSVAGGENTITPAANTVGGANPENDNWANAHAGLTFDDGFEADYLVILRNGNFGGDRFDVDFANVGGGLGAFEAQADIFGGSLTGSNASALPGAGIGVAFDNSNAAGVVGGTDASDAAAASAVTTGIELAIPLSAIGNPDPADILVSAMVNGSNHDFLSNQFLGGLAAPQANLGNPQSIDLGQFGGNQYFSVVPEPTGAALAGMVTLVLACSRRK